MTYKIKKSGKCESKYVVRDIYRDKNVIEFTNKKDAEKYLSYHRLRGNTSYRLWRK